MSRADVAYLLMAAMIALGVVVVLLSARYGRYRRHLMRGHRHAKRVWKPFWLP